MTITVFGIPGPQGSKRYVGTSKSGRGIMIESSKKVPIWREAVKYAVIEGRPMNRATLDGPLSVRMTFTLPKPKSAPKTRVTFPDKKPDLSKLVRSTEDALVEIGAIEDDARIVETFSAKRFPNEGEDALCSPGVVIRIQQVETARNIKTEAK